MVPEQVSNVNETPESENTHPSATDAVMNGVGEDFFQSLDESVNGGILEESLQSTSNNNSGNTLASPSEVQPQVSTDVETIKKRYSDSSR